MAGRLRRWLVGSSEDRSQPESARETSAPPSIDFASDPGTPAVLVGHTTGAGGAVVGESYRQDVIHALAGRLGKHGPEDGRRHHMAELICEPDNEHDPNAIRVEIGGRLVGYVPRQETVQYRPFIEWAMGNGNRVLCRAVINGGFETDTGEHAHLGVRLLHDSPLAVQYDGPLPTISRRDPNEWWDAVNVQGEEHHQDFLGQRLFERSIGTLRVGEDGRVQVVVGGTAVGRFTQKMSDRYRDLVGYAENQDGRATCYVNIWRGPNKVELAAQLPSAKTLDEWE